MKGEGKYWEMQVFNYLSPEPKVARLLGMVGGGHKKGLTSAAEVNLERGSDLGEGERSREKPSEGEQRVSEGQKEG